MAEQRKLIRLGNSSFAIALPKDWVVKAGLNKGDKVFVVPNSNGELMISSEFKGLNGKHIDLELKNNEKEDIKKNLHAAYTKGYSEINLKCDMKTNKAAVEEILDNYMSLEIIETAHDEIKIKDFFDIKEAKFENFVRRIDTNLREMFDILIVECKREKVSAQSIKEIAEIDKAVNKFYFLCSRIFIRGMDNPSILSVLKMSGNKLFNNWWVSFHLESLGDGLKYVLKWLNKLEPKKKEEIDRVLVSLRENYVAVLDAFYKGNFAEASEIIKRTEKLRSEIEKIGDRDHKNLKLCEALELIRKNIYQNAKMVLYMEI